MSSPTPMRYTPVPLEHETWECLHWVETLEQKEEREWIKHTSRLRSFVGYFLVTNTRTGAQAVLLRWIQWGPLGWGKSW